MNWSFLHIDNRKLGSIISSPPLPSQQPGSEDVGVSGASHTQNVWWTVEECQYGRPSQLSRKTPLWSLAQLDVNSSVNICSSWLSGSVWTEAPDKPGSPQQSRGRYHRTGLGFRALWPRRGRYPRTGNVSPSGRCKTKIQPLAGLSSNIHPWFIVRMSSQECSHQLITGTDFQCNSGGHVSSSVVFCSCFPEWRRRRLASQSST